MLEINPPHRFDISYGSGTIVGERGDAPGHLFDPAFEKADLTPDEWQLLAQMAGYANGCPVVPMVLEKAGAEAAHKRYTQINFWYGYLQEKLAEQLAANPDFSEANLFGIQPRRLDEPAGVYSPEWLPPEIHDYTVGAGSYGGFVMPRLWLIAWQAESNLEQHEKMIALQKVLATVAADAQNPTELVVLFAAELAKLFPNERALHLSLLKYLLNQNILEEENWRHTFLDVYRYLRFHASPLWEVWKTASSQEKEQYQLAAEDQYRNQKVEVDFGGDRGVEYVPFRPDEMKVLEELVKAWPVLFSDTFRPETEQLITYEMLQDRSLMMSKLLWAKSHLKTIKGTGTLVSDPEVRAARLQALQTVTKAIAYFNGEIGRELNALG